MKSSYNSSSHSRTSIHLPASTKSSSSTNSRASNRLYTVPDVILQSPEIYKLIRHENVPRISLEVHKNEKKTNELKANNHNTYKKGKNGYAVENSDPDQNNESMAAATEWAEKAISEESINNLYNLIEKDPDQSKFVIVPLMGAPKEDPETHIKTFNYIPPAFAMVLCDRLNKKFGDNRIEVKPFINQKVSVGRTGEDSFNRFLKQPTFRLHTGFDEEIIQVKCIVVDDHVTQGTSILNAVHFIHDKKGKVPAASALCSARLPHDLFVSNEMYDYYLRGESWQNREFQKEKEFKALYTQLSGHSLNDANPASQIALTASEFESIAKKNIITFATNLKRAYDEYVPNLSGMDISGSATSSSSATSSLSEPTNIKKLRPNDFAAELGGNNISWAERVKTKAPTSLSSRVEKADPEKNEQTMLSSTVKASYKLSTYLDDDNDSLATTQESINYRYVTRSTTVVTRSTTVQKELVNNELADKDEWKTQTNSKAEKRLNQLKQRENKHLESYFGRK